jgi:hypothetical protein
VTARTDAPTLADLRAQLDELAEVVSLLTPRGRVVLSAALERAERRVADQQRQQGG